MRWSSIILSLSSLIVVCQGVETETAKQTHLLQKKWTLYHSVGNTNEWTKRASVFLSVDTTTEVVREDGESIKKSGDSEGLIKLEVTNEQGCLAPAALLGLQDSQWYKLKLEEDGLESSSSLSVMTSVSACQIRRSNFRDEIALTFGRKGHVVSMAYMPLVSPLAPKSCDDLPPIADDSAIEFSSRISYEMAMPGMTLRTVLPSYQPPPGLKFISKKKTVASSATTEPSADGKSKTEGGSNPFNTEDDEAKTDDPIDASPFGFLRRYWYIILPLMIINFMSKADDPPPEEQQPTSSANGPAAATQQASAGDGTAATSRVGKRRGKRST